MEEGGGKREEELHEFCAAPLLPHATYCHYTEKRKKKNTRKQETVSPDEIFYLFACWLVGSYPRGMVHLHTQ